MKDLLSFLQDLRRPRLLIRAARLGVDEYQRDRHLKRHLGYAQLPGSGAALMQLVEKESFLNTQRKSGEAGYSVAEHVDLLIAIMGEARLVRASRSEPSA